MAVVTLDQARDHLRVDESTPAGQIQPYLDAAEDAASQYLNRKVFATAAALQQAIAALPAALTAARVALESANSAAALIVNYADRCDALAIASAVYTAARADTARTLNGVVVNPSIAAAVLLTLGHLFENREDVVVGPAASDLPNGARALLRPYRRPMMP